MPQILYLTKAFLILKKKKDNIISETGEYVFYGIREHNMNKLLYVVNITLDESPILRDQVTF